MDSIQVLGRKPPLWFRIVNNSRLPFWLRVFIHRVNRRFCELVGPPISKAILKLRGEGCPVDAVMVQLGYLSNIRGAWEAQVCGPDACGCCWCGKCTTPEYDVEQARREAEYAVTASKQKDPNALPF